MRKTYKINCGMAVLLNENSDMFESFDVININAGKVIIAKKLHQKLQEKSLSINSGDISYVDVIGRLVYLPENSHIGGETDYTGCTLFMCGSLVIDPEGVDRIKSACNLFVDGTVYYPSSMSLSDTCKIEASNMVPYPDGAQVLFEKQKLDDFLANKLRDNRLIIINNSLEALDETAFLKVKNKGITFMGKSLIIHENLYSQYSSSLDFKKITIIPEGHEVINTSNSELLLDESTKMLYGDKIYVRGNLHVTEKTGEYLKQFQSIVVEGSSEIPLSFLEDFKKIAKTKEMFVYQGTLLKIKGQETLSHEFLAKSLSEGIKYTIKCNGKLTISDNVTKEDLTAVAAIYYNGVIVLADEIRPAFQLLVKQGNGMLVSNLKKNTQLDDKPSGSDSACINTGTFVL